MFRLLNLVMAAGVMFGVTAGVQATVVASSHHRHETTTSTHRRHYHATRHPMVARHQPSSTSAVSQAPLLGSVTQTENCMAQAIYREAKSESHEGQAAVGYVVMNRTREAGYPNSVCGVIHQRARDRHGVIRCQFSWHCQPPPRRINAVQMAQAHVIARQVLNRSLPNPIGNALYFHEARVANRPSRHAPYHMVLGHHVFYSPTPLQRQAAPTALALAE